MGDQRAYERGRNDFYSYLYTSLSERVTINGVTGKMIEKKTAFKDNHQKLPAYAGTSDVYFSRGEDGFASQAKVYEGGKMLMDFDWDHSHTNRDGTHFHIGTVHVQEYEVTRVKKNGKYVDHFVRKSNKARLMTQKEIDKYGALLLHFNPNLKFK